MYITIIKKKKTTIMGMSNVLNEFLHRVSKGFQDAAFASFSRRRSTIREDINKTFKNNAAEIEKPKKGNHRNLSQMADISPKKNGEDEETSSSVEFQEL